jgi:hypothetical protein
MSVPTLQRYVASMVKKIHGCVQDLLCDDQRVLKQELRDEV